MKRIVLIIFLISIIACTVVKVVNSENVEVKTGAKGVKSDTSLNVKKDTIK